MKESTPIANDCFMHVAVWKKHIQRTCDIINDVNKTDRGEKNVDEWL